MNAEVLNIAGRETDESSLCACDFEDDAAPSIENDNEKSHHETSHEDDEAHADFDSHEMVSAVALLPPKPLSRRPMSEDRSKLALAAMVSIAVHLGIGVLFFVFATAFIIVHPQQTDQRLGEATSEGGYIDAAPSPNSDPANPQQDATPVSAPPVEPTDRHTDASDKAAPAPADSFKQASSDEQVAVNVDPNEPPPLIGLPADPLTAPAFPRQKPAVADSSVQASASAAATPSANAASSVAPPVKAAPSHVIGPAHAKGTPGGRRDGFELDERGIPIPEYPIESWRRREEGLVTLDLEILPNGRVGKVAIVDDGGHPRLANASVTAARAARFDAGTFDGQPVACHLIVPYRFTLR